MQRRKTDEKKVKPGRKPGTENKATRPVAYETNKIYTLKQVAGILQRSEQTILRMLRRGDLKGKHDSAGWLVHGQAIDEYMELAVRFKPGG